MRVGLADPFGIRRAVDAVALLGEIDPDQSDRIVRAGRDRELAVGVHALELEFRIVMIGGIVGDPADLELPARRRLLLAADRRRIERDELAVFSERAKVAPGLVDLDLGDAPGEVALADVGHQDRGAGRNADLAPFDGQVDEVRHEVILREQRDRRICF